MKRFVFDWDAFRVAAIVFVRMGQRGTAERILRDTGISRSSWHRFTRENGTLSLEDAFSLADVIGVDLNRYRKVRLKDWII